MGESGKLGELRELGKRPNMMRFYPNLIPPPLGLKPKDFVVEKQRVSLQSQIGPNLSSQTSPQVEVVRVNCQEFHQLSTHD